MVVPKIGLNPETNRRLMLNRNCTHLKGGVHQDTLCRQKSSFVADASMQRYFWAASNINKLHPNGLVLDAASGTGYGTSILSRVCNAIGIDITLELILHSRSRYGGANFFQGDLESSSLWDALSCTSFDAVASFETLEHCCNPDTVLRNFYDILKEGGSLMISVPNGIFERKDREGRSENPYHVHSFHPKEIYHMVASAGFKGIRTFGQYPIYGDSIVLWTLVRR